ncbi:uncharacterized protein BDR25DRAFT_393743 [Lindgomyces ingoldianus]|uniref:Uncharacterized protein n=1 Tax=Lindgomyces ingoldianus TaxID=673940 RepID=A0ACB6QUW0_9PLEO|nr:uncharacterized protein BDR25DRAFT_393743 [Lindgomyces ingoldianus]KAF2470670.1 hypothetical protein BDR25DRAFT_393743 [Lindgomyces ingoldianus]
MDVCDPFSVRLGVWFVLHECGWRFGRSKRTRISAPPQPISQHYWSSPTIFSVKFDLVLAKSFVDALRHSNLNCHGPFTIFDPDTSKQHTIITNAILLRDAATNDAVPCCPSRGVALTDEYKVELRCLHSISAAFRSSFRLNRGPNSLLSRDLEQAFQHDTLTPFLHLMVPHNRHSRSPCRSTAGSTIQRDLSTVAIAKIHPKQAGLRESWCTSIGVHMQRRKLDWWLQALLRMSGRIGPDPGLKCLFFRYFFSPLSPNARNAFCDDLFDGSLELKLGVIFVLRTTSGLLLSFKAWGSNSRKGRRRWEGRTEVKMELRVNNNRFDKISTDRRGASSIKSSPHTCSRIQPLSGWRRVRIYRHSGSELCSESFALLPVFQMPFRRIYRDATQLSFLIESHSKRWQDARTQLSFLIRYQGAPVRLRLAGDSREALHLVKQRASTELYSKLIFRKMYLLSFHLEYRKMHEFLPSREASNRQKDDFASCQLHDHNQDCPCEHSMKLGIRDLTFLIMYRKVRQYEQVKSPT